MPLRKDAKPEPMGAAPSTGAQRSAGRKLADLCGSELSAAQRGDLLTFVDRSSAQRSAETC